MANRTFEKLRASGKRCGRSKPYTIISAIARDFRTWPLRLNLIDSRERGFLRVPAWGEASFQQTGIAALTFCRASGLYPDEAFPLCKNCDIDLAANRFPLIDAHVSSQCRQIDEGLCHFCQIMPG